MEIIHHPEAHTFKTIVDGHPAYVTYAIHNGGLDIRHTVVPREIGGRGIAARLVQSAYDYALSQHLACIATCSYAAIWLQRHPEYHGTTSKDYNGRNSCCL
ncbi:MAG: N-acetyltransferase [Odoribacter sp.]|nr:N-acetyltransferase [Odoribacter sp.]